jgi:H+/Cl- antiporter ClcA
MHFFLLLVLTVLVARFLLAFLGDSIVTSWTLWTLFIVIATVAGVIFTHFVGPSAIGSGIPHIKTVLTGAHLKGLLDKRTFVAKFIGLTILLGSGIVIGKEGPFVHLSCIVAHQLLQLRFEPKLLLSRHCFFRSHLNSTFSRVFERIRKATAMHHDIMAAASSLGVSANFGAPLGTLRSCSAVRWI